MVLKREMLTIIILDDEVDILNLYGDYLSKQGHYVMNTYLNAETILANIDIESPDIYIIDYRLRGNKNGIEVASDILKKFPSSCIMFVTGYELLNEEISKDEIFQDKNIAVLIKPVRLGKLEDGLLNLVAKSI